MAAPMLRPRLSEALKTAMKARDERSVSTVRMILAKLKERDIEARGAGNASGIADDDIVSMMRGMIKQRHESAALYDQGKRPELAAKERDEVVIIEGFLPRQMSEAETAEAVRQAIAELGAASMKDMGKVMAALKTRHAGALDGAKASQLVKVALSGV
jgi:uncharacterized protein YqeY